MTSHPSSSNSIARKPLGPTSKSSDIPIDPPPYDLHDPRTEPRDIGYEANKVSPAMYQKSGPPVLASGPGQEQQRIGQAVELHPDLSGLAISDNAAPVKPYVASPTPPSPEMRRTTLIKPQPATETASHRHESDLLAGGHLSKLHKDHPDKHRRSTSLQRPGPSGQMLDLKTRQLNTSALNAEVRGRATSAQQASSPAHERPSSPKLSAISPNPVPNQSPSPSRGRLRRSWLPGSRSRSTSMDVSGSNTTSAWIMSDETRADYNTALLKNGEKVPELWNEGGTVFVHLFPRSTGRGASFKVSEFAISASIGFNELIQAQQDKSFGGRHRARSFDGRGSLSVEDATRLRSPPNSPPVLEATNEARLYLPVAPPSTNGQASASGQVNETEMDRLIGVRNLFAFMTGQPLVGTKQRPTVFQAFLQIAQLLREFDYTNYDGTSFGDAVNMSFSFYIEQLGFADCRHSREKTLEALVLGERMKSLELYNQAFAHAVGKYTAIVDLQLPIFNEVSSYTRQGLERAHLDLVNRQQSVNNHLEQFSFPSVFAGIANSTSTVELKQVRFKTWRNSYTKMRSFVQSHYKAKFGNWPPKASSKKNPFAESGLNRLVLKVLYSDLCALYDLLVDRTSLTTRMKDYVPNFVDAPAGGLSIAALRTMLHEYDHSTLPVRPPIPFDTPQLPSMSSVHATYDKLSAKDQAKFDKKLKENELILVLQKAYNYDTSTVKVPFLKEFKDFELAEARGTKVQDMVDQRIGYWLFLYVVIQSLPLLAVDAPGLKFTESVEYYLCEPPMGNPPWFEDKAAQKIWYNVNGGATYVQLSADTVNFSVEATYGRSHCWLSAEQWQDGKTAEAPQMEEPSMSPLVPPNPQFQGMDSPLGNGGGPLGTPPVGNTTPSPPLGGAQMAIRPRNLSPGRPSAAGSRRISMAMGLEPVPLAPPPHHSHHRSSSVGPPSQAGSLGHRSVSAGNLSAMGNRESQAPSPVSAGTGLQTFDDILGDSHSKPVAKKKSFFF